MVLRCFGDSTRLFYNLVGPGCPVTAFVRRAIVNRLYATMGLNMLKFTNESDPIFFISILIVLLFFTAVCFQNVLLHKMKLLFNCLWI